MFLIILLVISATLTIQLLAIRLAGHYLMQVHTLRRPRHLSLLCAGSGTHRHHYAHHTGDRHCRTLLSVADGRLHDTDDTD